MNTTDFLTISAAIVPDRPAIIFEGKTFTFGQLNERVNRLANSLVKMGVKKGDRVALLQVNCNQCVEAYFAVAKAGAVPGDQHAPRNQRREPALRERGPCVSAPEGRQPPWPMVTGQSHRSGSGIH